MCFCQMAAMPAVDLGETDSADLAAEAVSLLAQLCQIGVPLPLDVLNHTLSVFLSGVIVEGSRSPVLAWQGPENRLDEAHNPQGLEISMLDRHGLGVAVVNPVEEVRVRWIPLQDRPAEP